MTIWWVPSIWHSVSPPSLPFVTPLLALVSGNIYNIYNVNTLAWMPLMPPPPILTNSSFFKCFMSSIKKRLVQDLFNSHTKKRHALEGLKFRLRGSTRCTCSGILDGPERREGCTSSVWKLWKIGHSILHGVFWGCLFLGTNEGHFQAIIRPIKAFFYSS